MLFTDAQFISMDDVESVDPDSSNVVGIENLPGNIAQMAIEEAAATLEATFQNFDYNYLAGFQTNIGLFSSLIPFGDNTPKPRLRLGQVVVDSATTTYASPLKRWVTYLAIRNLYQVASNRFVGIVGTTDRYAQKMSQIQKDIDNKYWPALKSAGLPIVYNPVPCPGAVGEPGVGQWGNNANSIVQGNGTQGNSDFNVTVTWVTPSAESGPASMIEVLVPDGNDIQVTIEGLVPPAEAVAWKIYAGYIEQPCYYQATVPIGTTTFVLPDTPLFSGPTVGNGQLPDTNLTFINAFFRG